jgi:valine--pyruvate aminotransferase
MKWSAFGKKFQQDSGIMQLMIDLGHALTINKDLLMLGGGNPSHIPEVQERFRQRMQAIMETPGAFEELIGNYDSPQGNVPFIAALAEMLNREFGWEIGSQNIALTNGSQSAFFFLFNMFAGMMEDGSQRKILLPLAPEYIGYADVGLTQDFFVTAKPEIEFLPDHLFKYHIDFDAISIDDNIGAICVSRPTNPTGNVLTDEEVRKLSELARENDIPLLIDNAYGTPFPNIIFEQATPVFNEHTIVCMSLSKVGLPTGRTGIVIANEEVISAVTVMNAIVSLAPGKYSAALCHDLVSSGEIITISRERIQPFYKRKAERAVAQLRQDLEGVDYYIHKPEGALFLWLWCKGLPITCHELYERLKARGVLVVSGHYFFPGLKEEWPHKHECIRITYAQDDAIVEKGLSIIADEVKKAYKEADKQ